MIRVGIIGASGYTGAELMRIAATHPEIEVTYVTANQYRETAVADLYPNLTGLNKLEFQAFDLAAAGNKADVFFLGLPHGTSMDVAPALIDAGHRVIDLSGDFRLRDESIYESWYKVKHTQPQLLKEAVYGLPELYKERISDARFVSNPGCYVTSALLGLAPALSDELLETEGIIINALSGVSGAGRDAKPATHFCRVDENLAPYKVGGLHQHIPEIEQYLSDIAGFTIKVSFTPHLMPVSRGILSTIYADIAVGISFNSIVEAYKVFYQDKPFVQVLEPGKYPETKSVMGSNYCHIGLAHDSRTGKLIIMSAIDNLVKGASGQAVQNFNIMMGLSETTGLEQPGLMP